MLFPSIERIPPSEPKSLLIGISSILSFIGSLRSSSLVTLSRSFIVYETLIIMLSFISFPSLPSHHRIRTRYFLYVSPLLGSISSLVSLLMSSWHDRLLVPLLIISPFYIKIPCSPFSYRSPEVHCEVNTSIPPFPAVPERYALLLLFRIYHHYNNYLFSWPWPED